MREPPLPLSRVGAPVIPSHLSLALPHVLAELPLVYFSISPIILSIAIFPVPTKVAFEPISILTHPNAMAFPEPSIELPFVGSPVGPVILASSMRLAMDVVSAVEVAVGEVFDTIAMFDKTSKFS